jgi:ribonuclease P protein component
MQQRLRLRRGEDFQRVRQGKKSWSHPLLILTLIPNSLSHNRYGIITTRKLGGAVARNRAKRRLREAIRRWHPQIVPGYDLVFIARPAVARCPYPVLLEAVATLLQRADLLLK